MDNISITLVDKIGPLENGISFMLSLGIGGTFYDAMYWVNEDKSALATSNEVEELLGISGSTKPNAAYHKLLEMIEEKYPKALLIKELETKEEDDN